MKNLPILLAGAILYDLELEGIVTIQPAQNIIIGPLVHLNNITKPGNPILDGAIDSIISGKRNFPVSYWLSKFKSKKFRNLIIENLIHFKHIQQIGKKFEILNSIVKNEINEKIVYCVVKDLEPDKKLRLLLMLACLRSVNWKLLPDEIDFKDETIKEILEEYQEMMVKDTVGFYIAMQVPKTTYKIGGSIAYRF
ncbi:MAG: GPP34 family phosphoprotein [Candidatus Heimdallarchaeaceae archaeon]|jgi:hypothetical protein